MKFFKQISGKMADQRCQAETKKEAAKIMGTSQKNVMEITPGVDHDYVKKAMNLIFKNS